MKTSAATANEGRPRQNEVSLSPTPRKRRLPLIQSLGKRGVSFSTAAFLHPGLDPKPTLGSTPASILS